MKPEENVLTDDMEIVEKMTQRLMNDPKALGEI